MKVATPLFARVAASFFLFCLSKSGVNNIRNCIKIIFTTFVNHYSGPNLLPCNNLFIFCNIGT